MARAKIKVQKWLQRAVSFDIFVDGQLIFCFRGYDQQLLISCRDHYPSICVASSRRARVLFVYANVVFAVEIQKKIPMSIFCLHTFISGKTFEFLCFPFLVHMKWTICLCLHIYLFHLWHCWRNHNESAWRHPCIYLWRCNVSIHLTSLMFAYI